MSSFNPAAFAALVALVGLVILVASLASGVIERIGLPAVALFLAIGTLLGPHGLGLLNFGIESPALGTIATLSLVLVLFTDAVSVQVEQLKRHLKVALIVLGPGTLLSAAITAFAAQQLLGLDLPSAAILGAALSSTDPVMMRGLLRLAEVPGAAKFALRIESGLNDVVLLPIVLVAMTFLRFGPEQHGGSTGGVLVAVFVLGPLAGAAVAWVSVRAMVLARGYMGMRRDYESLYVLGIAFTAYALAEALHASGFMAAFAAGLTVATIDVELCDCFHDYGEATAEMLLLLSFIAFGTSLIWTGLNVISGKTLAFAAVALLSRPAVLWLALPRKGLDPVGRRLIVWFGPRALSSFLLVLLPVFAGLPGATALFPVTALVVMLSVVGHGAMLTWATHGLKRREERDYITQELQAELAGADLVAHPELITFEELGALQKAGHAVHILDVRTGRSYEGSKLMAAHAVRVLPDRAVDSAAEHALPKHDWLVSYCA